MINKMEAPAGGGAGERYNSAQSGQTTHSNTSILQAALELSGRGYAAVPLSAARLPMLKGWPSISADADETRRRFERADAVGIAIVTRGFFVLDLDRNHADGVDGIANFAALVAKYGDFPRHGPRIRSRRGGLHIYLALPEGL
ncbi:MAG: bifunctional DNA primase/polymerase [Hyphomonadaceae bacterium]